MNKFTKSIINFVERHEIEDMINIFELQDVNKAIGDKAFYTIIDTILTLDNIEDRAIILTSLDKLLNTNRSSLVDYDSKNPNIRISYSTEEKGNTMQKVVEHLSNKLDNCLYQSYPNISKYSIIRSTAELLGDLSYIEDYYTGDDLTNVIKDTHLEYIHNIINSSEFDSITLLEQFELLEESYRLEEVKEKLEELEHSEKYTEIDLIKYLIKL
ncbi:hypothetical protein qdsa001_49 [Staphylococcus phage qdsa001]|uniref:Uncharacterized protein n=5 Tax=Silviavirus remus TaxID=1857890 RepID=S4T8Y1_9CAUD|nr:hypothetical protein QLX36_gp147 [Staphylococcus phage vB_SauM_Romulus]YP_008431291.1 hypothetical protein O151_gp018 [Staphylococcus phage vB_SauM_Remus]ARQ95805.1 hypothetical protein qdsa001_49 [Staphylococcus phage qdsa001]QVD57690.1 hypothetical protein PM56_145 [Staphylococcus phage PM56]QVD58583.1 hypothetical protein PM93_156 [Staphylococcus phage PM93]QVD58786.1 hypothetical protein Remus_155 [Silviavirus remus]QVD58977.1 hypothetical protein Romulus_145 [Staphylococcus phage Romu